MAVVVKNTVHIAKPGDKMVSNPSKTEVKIKAKASVKPSTKKGAEKSGDKGGASKQVVSSSPKEE